MDVSQISMNAQQEHTNAVLMACAITPREHTTAQLIQDLLAIIVQVIF